MGLLGFVALFLFVPLAVAAMMPNAISLAVCATLMAVVLLFIGGDGHSDGPGGALGSILWAAMAVGTSVGLLARAAGLFAKARGYDAPYIHAPTLLGGIMLVVWFARFL